MGTWIYFREDKAAKGEEMGAAFHMPCPLNQWFSTCHCPYGLSRLWDPLPLPYQWIMTCSIKSWIPQHMSCTLYYHPPNSTQPYGLRTRAHNRTLPLRKSHLANCNFIIRMLYLNVYWQSFYYRFWPTVLSVEPMVQYVVCLSVCLSSSVVCL